MTKLKISKLKIRYKALNRENRRLSGENTDLKMRIGHLEMQQMLLENENKGTAEALNAQQDLSGKCRAL